jgi:hypothetical protein
MPRHHKPFCPECGVARTDYDGCLKQWVPNGCSSACPNCGSRVVPVVQIEMSVEHWVQIQIHNHSLDSCVACGKRYAPGIFDADPYGPLHLEGCPFLNPVASILCEVEGCKRNYGHWGCHEYHVRMDSRSYWTTPCEDCKKATADAKKRKEAGQ